MTIIDAHAHIGQGEMLDDPLQNGNTVEKVAGLMEQAGIARSIIFPVLYSDYSGPNQEMAELASKDKRFIGFGRIKAARADGAQQVSHAIEDLGLKGIKIHPEEGFPTREVMNAIDKLKVPVVFHSGFGTFSRGVREHCNRLSEIADNCCAYRSKLRFREPQCLWVPRARYPAGLGIPKCFSGYCCGLPASIH